MGKNNKKEAIVFHLTPTEGLEVLRPSQPAEDIIDGCLVWQDDAPGPLRPCVCFGESPEKILWGNPCIKGVIYMIAPDEDVTDARNFGEEARTLDEFLDSVRIGEVRFYRPVRVVEVGTFEMVPTREGLKSRIYLA